MNETKQYERQKHLIDMLKDSRQFHERKGWDDKKGGIIRGQHACPADSGHAVANWSQLALTSLKLVETVTT